MSIFSCELMKRSGMLTRTKEARVKEEWMRWRDGLKDKRFIRF